MLFAGRLAAREVLITLAWVVPGLSALAVIDASAYRCRRPAPG
jgi:hypothetical protein